MHCRPTRIMTYPRKKACHSVSSGLSLTMGHNGGTRALTKSVMNMPVSNVRRETGMSITFTILTPSGEKTHYAIDGNGVIRPITTKALYIPDIKQDLLAGRALIMSG
jgi:hypothetical protein